MSFTELAAPGTPASPISIYSGIPPSILFERSEDRSRAEGAPAPEFSNDLKLNQIVAGITSGSTEYNLTPFFHSPLRSIDAIHFRHEVFRDLENSALLDHIRNFAKRMRDVRGYQDLSRKLYYRFHKEGWFLQAVKIYCDAVRQFADELASLSLRSRGFLAIRDYLTSYIGSPSFNSMHQNANGLISTLSAIDYCIVLHGSSLTVRDYAAETDYSAEVERTFEKFQQGAVKDYRSKHRDAPGDMNHIEAKILEFVARLNPGPFSHLLDFGARHASFVDETIATFDREVQFYVAYLQFIAKFGRAGLEFCRPQVSDTRKDVRVVDGFDLALAQNLPNTNTPVVCNDFALTGEERIIVVSGPNQGGKTTFARMFGQLHYFARLGCPVPGRDARLFLSDQIFTHFEREEKIESLRGKLEDDLVRIHTILEQATPRSIIVMNEIFSSTTIQDETFLSRRIMRAIDTLDLLCVWVTFVDELASFSPRTLSMVSTVTPDNPALRTFKIVKRPADGLAYAMAIVEKYRLTYDSISERIRS